MKTTKPCAATSWMKAFLFMPFICFAAPGAQQPTENLMGTHFDLNAEEILHLRARGWVQYRDFGAKGDGKTDDLEAIVAAHAFANQQGLPVKADEGASYYLGGKALTAIIQTDTDFGTASFIIDDTDVENIKSRVFSVRSAKESFIPEGVTSLKRNQENIGITLPGTCLITVTNSNQTRYIRYGGNQNNGTAQKDIFLADQNGRVDMNAPIIWDFDEITEITAQPLDETTLTLKGGRFTTIANQAESQYTYYHRGIEIARSHVLVEGLEHRVNGEGDHGAPYGGFIHIRDCAHVTVRESLFTGRKTYWTIGSAGRPVPMGSYDILVNNSLNVSFIHCQQTNDINDQSYWGIMASNFSKNLLYDHCTFSRFDAHMGVANATVRNSTIGHQGIALIGSGLFTMENTTVHGSNFISLRGDYGSTWRGEFIIRNCVFIPRRETLSESVLIGGSNTGQHDFGYPCSMPERILIEGLRVEDDNPPADYAGVAVFADVRRDRPADAEGDPFPYLLPKELTLRKIATTSSTPLRISSHPALFQDTKVIID